MQIRIPESMSTLTMQSRKPECMSMQISRITIVNNFCRKMAGSRPKHKYTYLTRNRHRRTSLSIPTRHGTDIGEHLQQENKLHYNKKNCIAQLTNLQV